MKLQIKLSILVFLAFHLFHSSFAQKGSGFGVKAGLNYNTSGNYFKDANLILEDPGNNTGFHAGVFYQLGALGMMVRPEIIYTQTKFETDLGKVTYNKIDVPLLFRKSFLKIIGLSFGPSFHYTFGEKFSIPKNFKDSEAIGLGFQAGLGVNFGPVGLDLRFEREFNDKEYTISNVLGKNNFKSQQLILGLSFKIPTKAE
jgi:hypothetical protein